MCPCKQANEITLFYSFPSSGFSRLYFLGPAIRSKESQNLVEMRIIPAYTVFVIVAEEINRNFPI